MDPIRRTLVGGAAAMAAAPGAFAQPGPTDWFAGRAAGDRRDIGDGWLCWAPAGRFRMGSPASEPERRSGEDQVEVTLSRGFWIGRFPVTQTQWAQVMGQLAGELSAGAGPAFPAYGMSFAQAEAYCARLTQIQRAADILPMGWAYSLPTEAQWEYACRAGTTTATAFGDRLSSRQANFRGDFPYNGAEKGPSLNRTERVGTYRPNAWGLHDTHGNVFEWCRDWYVNTLPGGIDPDLHDAGALAARNASGGASRVRRGGCWADEGWPCRSAFRLRFEPERGHDHIGMRVVAVQV